MVGEDVGDCNGGKPNERAKVGAPFTVQAGGNEDVPLDTPGDKAESTRLPDECASRRVCCRGTIGAQPAISGAVTAGRGRGIVMDPNRQRVERVAKALNDHDWEAYEREFARDLSVEAPGLKSAGREARVRWVQGLMAAFPDGRAAVKRVFGDGEWVCAELTFAGTHTGPLASGSGVVPATNRTVEFPYCLVMRVRDGQIAELHEYFDQVELLTQLGLLARA